MGGQGEAMAQQFTMRPGQLVFGDLDRLAGGGLALTLDSAAWPAIEASAALVHDVAEGDARVYGINTGFGSLAKTSIARDRLRDLQRRIVLSHAAGVGAPLPDRVVRLVLALKISALAQGYSGCRAVVIERLIALYNGDVLPVVPSKGSVGASGDLAPLAHLAAVLIGVGEVRIAGQTLGAPVQPLGLAPEALGARCHRPEGVRQLAVARGDAGRHRALEEEP